MVGIRFHDVDGNEIELRQYWGTIMGFSSQRWIEVAVEGKNRYKDGEFLEIPAILEKAEVGRYVLHSTRESIIDPDYVCTWSMYPPGAKREE